MSAATVPNYGAALRDVRPVISAGDCVGAVVNGVCPGAGAPKATWHGQMVVPDLATDWSWNQDGIELSFPLRHGVRWHDGKPFTAKDIQCTWDLLTGKSSEKLRLDPRKDWYRNLEEVRSNGDYEVTFRLKRPQPSFIALLASGFSPVYPCHVPPRHMRIHPIGTGPFKFVEFTPNESIKVARNPDYWKTDRPYLDGMPRAAVRDPSILLCHIVRHGRHARSRCTFARSCRRPGHHGDHHRGRAKAKDAWERRV